MLNGCVEVSRRKCGFVGFLNFNYYNNIIILFSLSNYACTIIVIYSTTQKANFRLIIRCGQEIVDIKSGLVRSKIVILTYLLSIVGN